MARHRTLLRLLIEWDDEYAEDPAVWDWSSLTDTLSITVEDSETITLYTELPTNKRPDD